MDPRLEQLERFDRWLQICSPWDRLQLGLLWGLIHATLVSCILSILPPVQVCDPIQFNFVLGVCVCEPQAAGSESPVVERGDRTVFGGLRSTEGDAHDVRVELPVAAVPEIREGDAVVVSDEESRRGGFKQGMFDMLDLWRRLLHKGRGI